MKLIDKFWSRWSVQILAVCITIAELAPYLPEVREYLPPDWYRYAFYVVLAGRIIRQRSNGTAD